MLIDVARNSLENNTYFDEKYIYFSRFTRSTYVGHSHAHIDSLLTPLLEYASTSLRIHIT